MKTTQNLAIALLAALSLLTCRKDDLDPSLETPNAVKVKFATDLSVGENEEEKEIMLEFDKAAFRNGHLEIKVVTEAPTAFQTDPAATAGIIHLAVAKGDESASFTVSPVDNNLLDAERTVTFELTEVSEGFEIGAKTSSLLTILDDEMAVAAGFSTDSAIALENDQAGLLVTIQFSGAAPAEGKVIVKTDHSAVEGLFTTQPAMDATGKITLPVAAGNTSVEFRLFPNDDGIIKGHHHFGFAIEATEGAILKGDNFSFALELKDDELISKPKSYETFGGNWRAKKTYIYDETGRIHKIHWDTETPGLRTGTDTYYYAANGLVERVNHYPDHDEFYYQENGRIVRSETVDNGIKKEYSEYDYDPAGNVGGRAQYHRQSNGQYALSFIYIYLYDTEGNLYSQLTYIPTDDPEDPQLISTRTFGGYINVNNPFLTMELLPNVQAQPKLPASYSIEENGAKLEYQFTYEYDPSGNLPVKRIASNAQVTEHTIYEYY